MALTAEQIQNQLEAYLDTDEGKNLLAPMGMQAGGRLVGFAGPDRLTNNEEDKEEQESVFTSEEGSTFLTDLTEGLDEYFDSDEGKNLLAPMGMQAGVGLLVLLVQKDLQITKKIKKIKKKSLFLLPKKGLVF